MAILVILVLVILWGAVLLPPILRSRADSGAPSGIADFVGKLRSGLGHGHRNDAGLPPLQPIMGPVGVTEQPQGLGSPARARHRGLQIHSVANRERAVLPWRADA